MEELFKIVIIFHNIYLKNIFYQINASLFEKINKNSTDPEPLNAL